MNIALLYIGCRVGHYYEFNNNNMLFELNYTSLYTTTNSEQKRFISLYHQVINMLIYIYIYCIAIKVI